VTGRVEAFTIGTDDPETDESAAARRYAREIDARLVLRIADERAALDLLGAAIDAYTEPNADYSIFPTLLVSRTAREHVKVVLAGDGGDELFWGYTHRFGGALDRLRLPHGSDVGRFLQTKHTLMPEYDLEAVFPALPPLPEEFDLFTYGGADEQEAAQWLRWNEYYVHLARVLAKVDRASMHESLEVRLPLLDKEVIAVAVRTDWKSCLDVRRRIGKLPLRQALKRRLSYQSFSKKGFTVPMERWLVGPLRGLVRERLLEGRDLLGLEIDRAHLARMFARLEAGEKKLAWGMWLMLNLSLWEERHLAGTPRLPADWG
jgi:asparagine synthase (glutamine-hydrolysing)